jgi:hypothetical protein
LEPIRTIPTDEPSKIVRKRASASNSAAWLIAAEITTDSSSSERTSSSSNAAGVCDSTTSEPTGLAACSSGTAIIERTPVAETRSGFTRGSVSASLQSSERRSRIARPPRLWSRLNSSPT